MKSTSNGKPAPIREWSHNEARSSSHVFRSVLDCRVNLANDDATFVLLLLVNLIVVAQALLPVEVINRLYLLVRQLLHQTLPMNFLSDQRN